MIAVRCSFLDCVMWAKVDGLCATHDSQRRRGIVLKPLRRRPQTRPSIVIDGVVNLQLTRGMMAMIDPEDAELSMFNWFAVPHPSTWYAARGEGRTTTSLHLDVARRMGLDIGDGMLVDHKNRNGLDCRRGNLRLATPSQNVQNQRLSRRNTSGVKGVYWHIQDLKWTASVAANGVHHQLGSFPTKEDAIRARQELAAKLHGEFRGDP